MKKNNSHFSSQTKFDKQKENKLDEFIPLKAPPSVLKRNYFEISCLIGIIIFLYFFSLNLISYGIAKHNIDLVHNYDKISNQLCQEGIIANFSDQGGDFVVRPTTAYYIGGMNSISDAFNKGLICLGCIMFLSGLIIGGKLK